MSEREGSINQISQKKESRPVFYNAKLRSGINIYNQDPDGRRRYITGKIPKGAGLRVLFILEKRKNFSPGWIKRIEDTTHCQTEKLDVGLTIPWIVKEEDKIYTRTIILFNKINKAKAAKRPQFKQPPLSTKVFKNK